MTTVLDTVIAFVNSCPLEALGALPSVVYRIVQADDPFGVTFSLNGLSINPPG